MSARGLPVPAMVAATVGGLATVVLTTWMTVIAFVGGTMPLIGWETEGGLGTGLLWLVLVDPIVVAVCWLLTMVVVVPILALDGDE